MAIESANPTTRAIGSALRLEAILSHNLLSCARVRLVRFLYVSLGESCNDFMGYTF